MPDDQEQRQPWIKFYPADWRSDEALRLCSLAARGFWMECLALMHKGTPYGHLSLTGAALTTKELAVVVCASPGEVKRLQDELLRNNVPSVTPAGVWFSRRLIRDRERSKKGAENGAMGGNPAMLGASVPKADRPKRLNRANNPTKVAAVWAACGGHCHYCGVEMTQDDPYRPDAFQIDHVIPIAEGGTNDIANLRGACRRCNFAKGIGASVNRRTDDINGHTVNGATALRARDPEARSQKLEIQKELEDHRAEAARVCAQPVEMSEREIHRRLFALVRAELDAGHLGESEADDMAHLKDVAGKAHLPYDGLRLRKAIDAVLASRGQTSDDLHA